MEDKYSQRVIGRFSFTAMVRLAVREGVHVQIFGNQLKLDKWMEWSNKGKKDYEKTQTLFGHHVKDQFI